MDSIFDRSIGLLGKANFKKIQSCRLAIFGLGGVGGTVLEGFVRTGFLNFYIFDFDKVSKTNLNRQILYTHNDIGELKNIIAEKKCKEINPDVNIYSYTLKVDENISFVLKDLNVDFIIDAIDDVNGKIALAKYAIENNITIIMSMGMANRYSSRDLIVCKINNTFNDPLAKKVRYLLKKNDIDLSKIYCVCSKEVPVKFDGKLNSIITTPSAAGLCIVEFVISYLIDGLKKL